MDFQPRASHLVSTSREVILESRLYDLTGFDCCRTTGLPDSVSTSTQETRTLERRYAPEQGIWHMICTPCLLAIVWIEIHALYYRHVFGYLTAISEFLAG